VDSPSLHTVVCTLRPRKTNGFYLLSAGKRVVFSMATDWLKFVAYGAAGFLLVVFALRVLTGASPPLPLK
jgi:hypothetical protein